METKQIQVEMKNEEEGIVTARFATLGVKDLDGDVIEPGAFGNQKVKVSAYGHASWQGALPVGVGETREEDDQAIADLKFFMDTNHGADHFRTIKGLGDLGEWSFGFDVLQEAKPDEEQREAGVQRVIKEVKVHEVSPVLRGAGIGTQTLGVKCEACAAKDAIEEEEVEEPEEEPATTEEKTDDEEPGAKEGEDDLKSEILSEVARYEAMKVAAER